MIYVFKHFILFLFTRTAKQSQHQKCNHKKQLKIRQLPSAMSLTEKWIYWCTYQPVTNNFEFDFDICNLFDEIMYHLTVKINKTVIKVNGTITAFINFAPFVNRYRIHIPNVIGKTKENSDIINCPNGITCRI
jgi:hypothetical protein